MAGQPTKPGNWGDWAVIEHRPNKKRISCVCCLYYRQDGSCAVLPTVISEIGYNYWKQCDHFQLSTPYDTTEFRERVNRIKGDYSPYCEYTDNSQKQLTNLISHKNATKSTPKKAEIIDCSFCRYVAATNISLCRCKTSPHYAQKCVLCSSYQKASIAPDRPLAITTATSTAHKPVQVLPDSTNKLFVYTWKKTRSNKTSVTKSHHQSDKTSYSKCTESKSQPSKTMSNQSLRVVTTTEKPNPKLGCKYLDNDICTISKTNCVRGNTHCLFFKQR